MYPLFWGGLPYQVRVVGWFSSLVGYYCLNTWSAYLHMAMTVYRWKQEIRGMTHLHIVFWRVLSLNTFHPSHVPGIATPFETQLPVPLVEWHKGTSRVEWNFPPVRPRGIGVRTSYTYPIHTRRKDLKKVISWAECPYTNDYLDITLFLSKEYRISHRE